MTIDRATSNYIGGRAGTGNGPEQQVIDPSTGEVIWTYSSDTADSVSAEPQPKLIHDDLQ